MAEMWKNQTEVLEFLGISRSTLTKWRRKGMAPPMRRLPNGELRCRQADLEAYVDNLPEVD